MDIDIEKFKKIKEEAEKFYKEIGEIYCPYFQETISLMRKGWTILNLANGIKHDQ